MISRNGYLWERDIKLVPTGCYVDHLAIEGDPVRIKIRFEYSYGDDLGFEYVERESGSFNAYWDLNGDLDEVEFDNGAVNEYIQKELRVLRTRGVKINDSSRT